MRLAEQGRRIAGVLALVLAALPAAAGVKTYVTHAGPGEPLLRLGLPVLDVRVTADFAADTAPLEAKLEQDLGRLVYSRPVQDHEPSDFVLTVTLHKPQVEVPLTQVAFEASLTAVDGTVPWRITGRSEVEDAPLDEDVLEAIARSVLSALLYDQWVQPRYDPEDPPPQAPVVRRQER